MAYKGKYRPSNPKKYKGNPSQVIYRSLWERKFMVYCDNNDNILEWGSETVIIPYVSPWDGKVHRYFPDFIIKAKQSNGSIRSFVIEVKPKYQCKSPPENPKRKTKRWFNDVKNWTINQAKWKYANDFCIDNGYEFKILTEDQLNPKYK